MSTQTHSHAEDRDATISRRRALTLTSVFGLFGAGIVAAFSNLLFFRPRVTYGEPSRFRTGKPVEVAACLVPDPLAKIETYDTIGLYAWNAEKKVWEHVDSGLPRNEVYRDIACADFNADGHLDLLAFSLESGGVFYLGDGNGGFKPKGRLPGIYGIGRIAIGDIDGDKLPDVAVAIPATKEHPEIGGVRAFLNHRELWK